MSKGTLQVKGIKPPNARWEKMKAVYDACTGADIDPPDEVREFFDWEAPDSVGVVVDLYDQESATTFESSSEFGCEITISALPDGVEVIRVYNTW